MNAYHYRGFERIIIALIGGFCIYLGYDLFAINAATQGQLKVAGKGAEITLSDVAPGIFFAFIGAALLLGCVFAPYKGSTESHVLNPDTESNTSGTSGDGIIEIITDSIRFIKR